jgi:hypothetical protein
MDVQDSITEHNDAIAPNMVDLQSRVEAINHQINDDSDVSRQHIRAI